MSDRPKDPLARWALPGLLALLVLSCLGVERGLWTPDEPREAEIGREMLLAPGVVPTLNGVTFIEKPPLYYWLVAGAYRLAGGAVPAAARAVSVAAGYLTLVCVFLWGRRSHSTSLGLVAAVLLGTSLQFVLTGHWILVDPLLMLFTTLGAWSGWELLQRRGGRSVALLLYASLAFALWTKGLIGPVLVGAGLGGYLLVTRRDDWRAAQSGPRISRAGRCGRPAGPRDLPDGRSRGPLGVGLGQPRVALRRPRGAPATSNRCRITCGRCRFDPALAGAAGRHLAPGPLAGPDGRAAGCASYALVMAGCMLVVLSASATKRGIYLMPVLPLICMAFAGQCPPLADRPVCAARFRGDGGRFRPALLGVFAARPAQSRRGSTCDRRIPRRSPS